MDIRLIELAQQATGVFLDLPGECLSNMDKEEFEKFAELIIKECINAAQPKLTDVGEWAAGMRLCQKRIATRFGVE